MTELNVLDAYHSHLTELVRKHSRYVQFEDALSDAQIVFLLAVRGYQPAFHGAFWADFACPQIVIRLKELQELLSLAPNPARQVGRRIIDKYSQAEIQQEFLLSEPEYQNCLSELRTAWETYNRGCPY
mgnify:FL=1